MIAKHCKLKRFIERTLMSIHTHMAPIDYSVDGKNLIRFDSTTYRKIFEQMEKEGKMTEQVSSILIDIIKTVLVIQIPGEEAVQKDYTKQLDSENLWVNGNCDDDRNSVIQYVYNNTLILLFTLRQCFGKVYFIEAIEKYLLNRDYFSKTHMDDKHSIRYCCKRRNITQYAELILTIYKKK